MAADLRIAVNSQTPLIRFVLPYFALLDKYGYLDNPIDISKLEEKVDYQMPPGGVTAMIFPLLRRLMADGIVKSAHWVSLGPGAPPEILGMGIHIVNIDLGKRDLPHYANFKEAIWNDVHGLGIAKLNPQDYQAYTRYNWLTARTLLDLLPDIDLYFIHDFQQLQVGHLIGPAAPTIFEWHIPFRMDLVSQRVSSFITKNLPGFDSVIVSTKKDLDGLMKAGYAGRAYQMYPYIDQNEWGRASQNLKTDVMNRFRLRDDDIVLLTVGRMDRMKSQDVAIKGLALLRDRYPTAKLLLIGDGSFSASSEGGLSQTKGSVWLSQLKTLTRDLMLDDSVIFAGFQPDEVVDAAYSISDVTLVPSSLEGFNLTTLEAWANKRPVVVSQGAGSSELVGEGINGYTFSPRNHEELAEKIAILLSNSEGATKIGENGSETARVCSIDQRLNAVRQVFEDVMKGFVS